MRIGLIDVDGRNYPNLPLMKLSAWHKSQGDKRENMGERYTIFYDRNTERTPVFERNLEADGFTVKALPEPKKARRSEATMTQQTAYCL